MDLAPQALHEQNTLESKLMAEFAAEFERAIAAGLRHRAAPLAPPAASDAL